MQQFDIDIEPDGSVRIEGSGDMGPDCKTLTKEIEQALGTVTSSQLKPEYHRAPLMKRKV